MCLQPHPPAFSDKSNKYHKKPQLNHTDNSADKWVSQPHKMVGIQHRSILRQDVGNPALTEMKRIPAMNNGTGMPAYQYACTKNVAVETSGGQRMGDMGKES
ncbi:hypothetical protein E2P81_ATG09023 [Venturia nashicola]|uniref:Uncharacterized protein n=1 Tax=Venturia nashicola TaxID=86259 RepID=A0A4Z1NKP9_9PEZI|nr:hypothetical protein E6O75_ATG09223 [Venturia nashicola]TLD23679.1 hypothetical protein E2P81_ATG09023 [Venturia nashicola]